MMLSAILSLVFTCCCSHDGVQSDINADSFMMGFNRVCLADTVPADTMNFVPVVITTGKLTISGGGVPLPPQYFSPVLIRTTRLTISGGGTPLPPKPPFQPVTVRTEKLTISGKPAQ